MFNASPWRKSSEGFYLFGGPGPDLTSNIQPGTMQSAGVMGSGGGVGGQTSNMQDLYARIMGMNPTTTTQTRSTQTQQQNRSPEFEATSRQFVDMLNQLSANTTGAYQNKQNTYTDLIKSLSDLFGARGSAAAGSTQASALASGLTPLEASGAGNNALLANLQQFFPALAGLRGEAADVGIANQAALQGIQQQLNLPFISNVLAPYQQNVSGQVTTGNSTQTTTNPMAKMNLLANMLSAVETQKYQQQSIQQGDQLGWAKLMADIQQNQAQNQLGQGQLEQGKQEAEMRNALGLGNLNVAQGGLMAQLAQLVQQGQQFDVGQQNTMTKAQGDWANQLMQIVLQGQNAMGTQWAQAESQNWLNNQNTVPDTSDIDW